MKHTKLYHRLLLTLAIATIATSCGAYHIASYSAENQVTIKRQFSELSSNEVDSLVALYGENKHFIDEYLQPTLIALSHFPELKNTHIEFKYSKEATTMAARPKPLSMLWRRRYIVAINNREDFEGIPLSSVPFNAQIGIIGHELSHIADYQANNLFSVTSILLRYANKKQRAQFEKEVDRATIERGLGWQLYDWAQEARFLSDEASDEYKEFKRANYMQPNEIEHYIKQRWHSENWE